MKLSATKSISAPGLSRRGVALVITLIMLSIITFLAVAFLSLTRRERAAVTVTLDQTDTQLMIDSGVARAQQEIMNRFLNAGTLLNYDLLVSTNFETPGGVLPANLSPVNLSYWDPAGNLHTGPDLVTVVANLLYDPRPPVFVPTNATAPWDFRFYHDVNRNRTNEPVDLTAGLFGDPQWIGVLENPNLPNGTNFHGRFNRFLGRFAFIALPMGKSLDVNFVHNASKSAWNPNPILRTNMSLDGFLRNQGLGNSEYNLAGFLGELNPNFWFYTNYVPDLSGPSGPGVYVLGDAFRGALDVLALRYGTNLLTLQSLGVAHPNFALETPFDGIDAYSDSGGGIGGINSYLDTLPLPFNDDTNQPWAGSRNTNAIFNFEELVNAGMRVRYPDFHTVLTNAMDPNVVGTNLYNRGTLYRMLAQMGTDSAVPSLTRLVPSGLLTNLPNGNARVVMPNHDYAVGDYVRVLNPQPPLPWGAPFGGTFRVVAVAPNAFEYENHPMASTNVPPQLTMPPPTHYRVRKNNKINLNFNNLNRDELRYWAWTPREFFMAVGERLLRSHTNSPVTNILSVTNIPVWDHLSRNAYEGKVHQLLQIAANLWDASTTNSTNSADFPTIFRPIVATVNTTNAAIVDWVVETDANFRYGIPAPGATNRYVDLTSPTTRANLTSNDIPFGQPFIVGAKKGHPNFNEFTLQNELTISRNLALYRPATNQPPNRTNQMYLMRMRQALGIEAWNSYVGNYARNVRMEVFYDASITITNGAGAVVWPPGGVPLLLNTNFTYITNFWPGALSTQSFIVPIATNFTLVTNAVWSNLAQIWKPQTNSPDPRRYETNANPAFYDASWTLVVSNKLRYFLVDTDSNRLVDIVNLTNEMRMNIMETLNGQSVLFSGGADPRRFWDTNHIIAGNANTPTRGIEAQIATSLNAVDQAWDAYNPSGPLVNSKAVDVAKFNLFKNPNTAPGGTNLGDVAMQTPFNPYRRMFQNVSWQANDPLVHYTANDLFETNILEDARLTDGAPKVGTIGEINVRYQPWGGHRPVLQAPDGASPMPQYDFNVAFKDPLVRWSDDWNFPSNKFGNAGMIGRVHRGTPWQTVYFKGKDITTLDEWFIWSGNRQTQPTNDLLLADIFTVAVNEESQRGLLSVNQSNSAAWAALLSGMPFLTDPGDFNSNTNFARPFLTNRFIGPGSPELAAFYNSIQNVRTNQPGQVFSNLAQFLAVPELSAGFNANSPMFSTNRPDFMTGLIDQSYERFADQALSLLTVEETPRFAVYVWGQSLKPAANSLVNSAGANFGLCTNYQITGESAAKMILRVEKRFNPVDPTRPTLHSVVESFQYLPTP